MFGHGFRFVGSCNWMWFEGLGWHSFKLYLTTSISAALHIIILCSLFIPPATHWQSILEILSPPLSVERTLCPGKSTVLVRAPCALRPP